MLEQTVVQAWPDLWFTLPKVWPKSNPPPRDMPALMCHTPSGTSPPIVHGDGGSEVPWPLEPNLSFSLLCCCFPATNTNGLWEKLPCYMFFIPDKLCFPLYWISRFKLITLELIATSSCDMNMKCQYKRDVAFLLQWLLSLDTGYNNLSVVCGGKRYF